MNVKYEVGYLIPKHDRITCMRLYSCQPFPLVIWGFSLFDVLHVCKLICNIQVP